MHFTKPFVPCTYNKTITTAIKTSTSAPVSLSSCSPSFFTFAVPAPSRALSPMATISGASTVIRPRLTLGTTRLSGLSVSFSNKGRSTLSFTPCLRSTHLRVSCAAKPETVNKVCEIVKKQLALSDDSAVTAASKFSELGADSLDTVEIVMGLEEEFGISVEEDSAQSIATVQDAADLIEKLVEKKGA